MKNYDWKNSFPEPPREFHEKLCHTLDSIEKEQIKMKKITIKRSLIIAAAAALVVGSAAIASSGTVRLTQGASSSRPDYREVPTEAELTKDIGFAPKIIDEFSNGYIFKSASTVKNRDVEYDEDADTIISVNGKYKSIFSRYEKDGDEITISAETYNAAEPDQNVCAVYNGVKIGYTSYTGKFVPVDYEKTEQDIKDESEGKIIFSYGTDQVEIYEIQNAEWTDGGIKYCITAMSSPLSKDELISMAEEMID